MAPLLTAFCRDDASGKAATARALGTPIRAEQEHGKRTIQLPAHWRQISDRLGCFDVDVDLSICRSALPGPRPRTCLRYASPQYQCSCEGEVPHPLSGHCATLGTRMNGWMDMQCDHAGHHPGDNGNFCLGRSTDESPLAFDSQSHRSHDFSTSREDQGRQTTSIAPAAGRFHTSDIEPVVMNSWWR